LQLGLQLEQVLDDGEPARAGHAQVDHGAIEGLLPRWIVIAVVSRDIMIMGAVILSWIMNKPVAIQPLIVSKLNTAAQIGLAALMLASSGFNFNPGQAKSVALILAGGLTIVSAAAYLVEWMKHISSNGAELKR